MIKFSSWGQTFPKQRTYWQNIKCDQNRHGVEQFAYDLKGLGKKKRMSGEETLEHFKETSSTKKSGSFA